MARRQARRRNRVRVRERSRKPTQEPRATNHEAAVALNYFAYNFIRIHRTLRVTPAMAAGVTTRLYDVADLVALLVESESKKAA
jgi:hypothetical protein